MRYKYYTYLKGFVDSQMIVRFDYEHMIYKHYERKTAKWVRADYGYNRRYLEEIIDDNEVFLEMI